MYSVNGVPLKNTAYGWHIMSTNGADSTKPLLQQSKVLQTLRVPGVDGVVRTSTWFDAPNIVLVVRTPKAFAGSLVGLMSRPDAYLTLTSDTSKRLYFELVTSSYVSLGPADSQVAYTFTLRIPGAFWRDASSSSGAQTTMTGAAAQKVAALTSTAPIGDAMIGLQGPFTSVAVSDMFGLCGFQYTGSVPSGQWLIYNMAQLTAYITPGHTNIAAAIADATHNDATSGLQFTGDPLRILPTGDPTDSMSYLLVSPSGAAGYFQVLGQGAYIV